MVVREMAVDIAKQLDDLAAKPPEQVADEGASHAVTGVQGDFHRTGQLDVADDTVEVLLSDID
ncbi:hypothetical protein D3C71_2172130 [compost metagenome]